MGYTHYWHRIRDFHRHEWETILKDCRLIFKYCSTIGVPLSYEFDSTKGPAATKKHIHFNGRGDLGHETFIITPTINPLKGESPTESRFDFCKTAHKPYDLAVCLCLLRMAEICPDFRLQSDGSWEHSWHSARLAYLNLFSAHLSNPFS